MLAALLSIGTGDFPPRAAQSLGARPEGSGPRRRRLLAFCLQIGTLVPLGAEAQTTEPLSPVPAPLLPVPAPPIGPAAPVAPGQLVVPSETVMLRPHPEYDPIGFHTGDFFWFPRGEVDGAYNSNIFALPSPTSDLIATLQPSFDLLSSLPRNSLNLHGTAAFQEYAQHSSQNTASGLVSVDGHLDVTNGSSLYSNAQVLHSYLSRGSPNSPGNAAEPVTYNNYTASVGYSQTKLRVGYEADVAVQTTQYNAVPTVGGGILPESSGDTVSPQVALSGSYEIVPDYNGYIRTSGTRYDYTHTPPGGVNFNSTIYRADLGLQILPRHIIYGEVYFGYLRQIFDLSSLGSASAPDAGGRLIWNVTRLTTLTFNGLRAFQTTNPSLSGTGTGAGYLNSSLTANIDHESRRNLVLNANAAVENDSYQGISRTDDVFTLGAGLRYLLNRNLYVGATYTYQQRTSTGSAATLPYAQSIVMLRLSTQF